MQCDSGCYCFANRHKIHVSKQLQPPKKLNHKTNKLINNLSYSQWLPHYYYTSQTVQKSRFRFSQNQQQNIFIAMWLLFFVLVFCAKFNDKTNEPMKYDTDQEKLSTIIIYSTNECILYQWIKIPISIHNIHQTYHSAHLLELVAAQQF